jgi:PAS domain-containing protein
MAVTGRTGSEGALRASEQRYRDLFEESPISLWEEDFSAVKAHIDELRAAGIADLSAHFAAHPEAVLECARLVKIVQVNQATVELAEGTSEEDFLANLGDTFTSETYELFAQDPSRPGGELRDPAVRRSRSEGHVGEGAHLRLRDHRAQAG